METKFTKGEWFTEDYSTLLNVSAKGSGSICDVDTDYITDEYVIDPTEEQRANAHLIAAAPDMYELLEGISLEARSFVDRGGKATTWLRDAESLLSKARGE